MNIIKYDYDVFDSFNDFLNQQHEESTIYTFKSPSQSMNILDYQHEFNSSQIIEYVQVYF
jgi:hypothetical protein